MILNGNGGEKPKYNEVIIRVYENGNIETKGPNNLIQYMEMCHLGQKAMAQKAMDEKQAQAPSGIVVPNMKGPVGLN